MEAAGLARWKLPESVVCIDGSLPTTASGKVQRGALADRARPVWEAARP
jgi:acyl-CoA synthetase (AMP-forming)/AMP-acid ligase II